MIVSNVEFAMVVTIATTEFPLQISLILQTCWSSTQGTVSIAAMCGMLLPFSLPSDLFD